MVAFSRGRIDSKRTPTWKKLAIGCLALLVVAVIALGPVSDIASYGEGWDTVSACERELRSPKWFMASIRASTFVIEGTKGNAIDVNILKRRAKDAPVQFVLVEGADHFSVIAPACNKMAEKLTADTGPVPSISVTAAEFSAR